MDLVGTRQDPLPHPRAEATMLHGGGMYGVTQPCIPPKPRHMKPVSWEHDHNTGSTTRG